MRDNRKLQIEQLNKKMDYFKEASTVATPNKGWLKLVRATLNMTLAQLGNKLGITKQGVLSLEESEAKGSISLKSLSQAAEAMDMKLVYGLVPKEGNLEEYIDKKAEIYAKNIVMRTNQTMKLEDQAIEYGSLEKSIAALKAEIKRDMLKSLWD